MELLHRASDIFLHLDQHLNDWAGVLGPLLYLVVFAVVFCETGLVVTPFLPGDSLLFALGTLCSIEGSPISLPLMGGALFLAARPSTNAMEARPSFSPASSPSSAPLLPLSRASGACATRSLRSGTFPGPRSG